MGMGHLTVRMEDGRGRCLVAETPFQQGSCILRAAAVGHALYERQVGRWCHSCLLHCPCDGSLSLRCSLCGAAAFCSPPCAALHSPEECKLLRGIEAQARAGSVKHGVLFEARWLASTVTHSAAARGCWGGPSEADALSLLGVHGAPAWRCVSALAQDNRDVPGFLKRAKRRKEAVEAFAKSAADARQQPQGRCDVDREADSIQAEPAAADLDRILGAAPLNDFGLYDSNGDLCGRANFPLAALANHSCVPNAAARQEGRHMCFYALRDIEKGEEICHCYVNLDEPEVASLINNTWGFTCNCRRCIGEDCAAFDAAHRCECGAVVAERNADGCVCNALNLVANCSP